MAGGSAGDDEPRDLVHRAGLGRPGGDVGRGWPPYGLTDAAAFWATLGAGCAVVGIVLIARAGWLVPGGLALAVGIGVMASAVRARRPRDAPTRLELAEGPAVVASYSVSGARAQVVAVLAFGLASVGGLATAERPVDQLLLFLLVLFFLGSVIYMLGTGLPRWRIVVTASALVVENHDDRVALPWHGIDAVVATRYGSQKPAQRYIGLVLNDSAPLDPGNSLARTLRRSGRWTHVDLAIPVIGLACDPSQLLDRIQAVHAEAVRRNDRPRDSSAPSDDRGHPG